MVWWVEEYLELLKYEICLKFGWFWVVFALMLMAMWLFPNWPAMFYHGNFPYFILKLG